MSDLPRAQHITASGLVALVGAWVVWLSWTQEPAAAFLFPRMISTVFVVLAFWTFGKALLGRSRVGAGLAGQTVRNIAPGLIVALVYLFWAATALGFYTASTLAIFVLIALYDPAPHSRPATWVRRILVTAGTMAVLYGLFALLLNVFMPRGAFF